MKDNQDSKVWLTGQGIFCNKLEQQFNVTLENINFSSRFYSDLHQVHLSLSRQDLILIRDAILKEIKLDDKYPSFKEFKENEERSIIDDYINR